MLAKRKNRGFTLIEAIISVFLLTILSIGIFTFQGVVIESKEKEKEIIQGVFLVESIRNMILCNLSYKELESLLIDKVLFINKESVEDGSIYTKHILSLVEKYNQGNYPLMEIKVQEKVESQVMEIEINYKYLNGEEISNVFYRGKYEKN